MNADLDTTIRSTIDLAGDGIGIDRLVNLVGHLTSKRTILRRLEDMLASGKIERTGKARATRYHLVRGKKTRAARHDMPMTLRDEPMEDSAPVNRAKTEEITTPRRGPEISTESRKLRDIIRQQQAFRKTVGYRREFLEKYIPNKTAYLPDKMRAHLHAEGQSDEMAALPPGTYTRHVMDRLIIDLSWNSSRLEGNTFSLLETDHLLTLGRSDDPARAKEARMILNHKAAIEFLVDPHGQLGFNRYTFFNLHALLAQGLLESHKAEGALRLTSVGIGGTVFHPCNEPPVVEECFDLILKKAGAIRDPLECAFFLMVHMPYLQPFLDGNKRTSRLAANIPLIQKNMAPLSFVEVPVRDYTDGILAVYELNRVEVLRDVFAWAYERSARQYAWIKQEMGAPDPIDARYSAEMTELVREVVVRLLKKPSAAHFIQTWAARNITASDRDRFVTRVESRLLSITEYNGARYRLLPSELAAWLPVWTGRK